jgi:hypothetical protein
VTEPRPAGASFGSQPDTRAAGSSRASRPRPEDATSTRSTPAQILHQADLVRSRWARPTTRRGDLHEAPGTATRGPILDLPLAVAVLTAELPGARVSVRGELAAEGQHAAVLGTIGPHATGEETAMRTHRPTSATLVGAVLTVLVLAGGACSGDDDDEEAGRDGTSETTSAESKTTLPRPRPPRRKRPRCSSSRTATA